MRLIIKDKKMKLIYILLIGLMLLACNKSTNDSDDSGKNELSGALDAPDFILQTVSGDTVQMSNYRGKVLYIFFVGYNCPPCVGSAPATEEIYQMYVDRNFVVLAIDVWDGNLGEVAGFKSKTGVTYSVCLDGSKAGLDYGVTNDYSVIVDSDGKMRYRAAGVNTKQISDVLETLFD